MPEVLPENADLWRVLHFSPGVWKEGFSGPYAIDYVAVRDLAALLEIQITKEDFLKIRAYERAALTALAEKRKLNSAAAKPAGTD